jgi:hypothetical protein
MIDLHCKAFRDSSLLINDEAAQEGGTRHDGKSNRALTKSSCVSSSVPWFVWSLIFCMSPFCTFATFATFSIYSLSESASLFTRSCSSKTKSTSCPNLSLAAPSHVYFLRKFGLHFLVLVLVPDVRPGQAGEHLLVILLLFSGKRASETGWQPSA